MLREAFLTSKFLFSMKIIIFLIINTNFFKKFKFFPAVITEWNNATEHYSRTKCLEILGIHASAPDKNLE